MCQEAEARITHKSQVARGQGEARGAQRALGEARGAHRSQGEARGSHNKENRNPRFEVGCYAWQVLIFLSENQMTTLLQKLDFFLLPTLSISFSVNLHC